MFSTRILAISFFALSLSATAQTEQTEQQKSMEAAMAMMGGGAEVDVQDEYKFDHRFVVLMESFNKKGKAENTNEMTFMMKEGSRVMGIRMNQEGIATEVVYDYSNYEIVTLMNTQGQKMGTTMSIDPKMADKYMENMKNDGGSRDDESIKDMPSFEKTGNTKTISGYTCDEYVFKNAEENGGKVTYWITDETDVDWVRAMSGMSSMNPNMPNMYGGSGYPEDGSVIQMIMEQKNGEKMTMTVKEAELNKDFSIKTAGYTFMNMGNMGGR